MDAWYDMKSHKYARPTEGFQPIHMPSNTWAGIVIAGVSTVFGLAMVWYIWWLAALSFVAVIGVAIFHTFNYKRDFHIPVEEVIETERRRTADLQAAGA